MPLLEFSEEETLLRMKFENPWWSRGKIEPFYSNMLARPYLQLFWQLLRPIANRAIVLMGPRRVGKTVMMYHTIARMIDEGGNPLKIAFVSVETPIYLGRSLDELFALARKATGQLQPEGWCVLFDEIQYLKDWELHLKRLVDDYPATRFIVSGSAAAALKMKSQESGAGRFTEFLLPPLTFSEYIELRSLNNLILKTQIGFGDAKTTYYQTHNVQELNRHFVNYINFGGYPEVALSDALAAESARYLRSDIVDKVLLRDLPTLYGIRDVQELNALFGMLAFNSGCEVSFESLSTKSGVDKTTLKRYLEYLEAAFLIKVVRPVTESAKHFQRIRQFKVYLTNTSLRAALFSPVESITEGFGNLVETAIFDQWLHRPNRDLHYARWGTGEVDLIWLNRGTLRPHWAVEVKWSNRYFDKPTSLTSLLKFCRENDLSRAVVTTLEKTGERTVENIQLIFVPASTYTYTVGKRVFEEA